MSKIKFQIGGDNHVKISLPSKMEGNGDTFVGTAKVRISTLACSRKIRISRTNLDAFFENIETAYRRLKGTFALESERDGFALAGHITAKGRLRINVKVGFPLRDHPDYNEWYVETAFNCDAECLKDILDSRSSKPL